MVCGSLTGVVALRFMDVQNVNDLKKRGNISRVILPHSSVIIPEKKNGAVLNNRKCKK